MVWLIAETSAISRKLGAAALCLPMVCYGIFLFRRAFIMREWQRTTGTILSFKDELTRYGGRALILYSYSVDGKSHKGNRITLDDWLIAHGALQVHLLRKKFPVGASVFVNYDPLHPEQSVLCRPGYT